MGDFLPLFLKLPSRTLELGGVSLLFTESCSLSRRRQWHPTPVPLPAKSHGWRSLVGCSPRGCEESDTTERLHFHFSLSCTGEGNGSPLQCSCLENPTDGGAWWAAVYGVAQSRTRLKRLSSSSSSSSLSGTMLATEALRLPALRELAFLVQTWVLPAHFFFLFLIGG